MKLDGFIKKNKNTHEPERDIGLLLFVKRDYRFSPWSVSVLQNDNHKPVCIIEIRGSSKDCEHHIKCDREIANLRPKK